MHMGGFKEFFLSCFLFPGLVIIYILSPYMYTQRILLADGRDGYLQVCAFYLGPKMVKSSDKWWCYVDPLALILNARICVPNKTTDVLGRVFLGLYLLSNQIVTYMLAKNTGFLANYMCL